jgi:hypothetical protein
MGDATQRSAERYYIGEGEKIATELHVRIMKEEVGELSKPPTGKN